MNQDGDEAGGDDAGRRRRETGLVVKVKYKDETGEPN